MNNAIAVSSSMMDAVRYDDASKMLGIHFIGEGWYSYFNVSKPIYLGLVSAPSKGRYFHSYIKDHYRFAH